jgi:hypothetical protein
MCIKCKFFYEAKNKEDIVHIFSKLNQFEVNEICSHAWRYIIIPKEPKLSSFCDNNKLTISDYSNLMMRFRDVDYLFDSFKLKTNNRIILSSFYRDKELQRDCLEIKNNTFLIESSWLDVNLVHSLIKEQKINPLTDFDKLPELLNNNLFTLHKWRFGL